MLLRAVGWGRVRAGLPGGFLIEGKRCGSGSGGGRKLGHKERNEGGEDEGGGFTGHEVKGLELGIGVRF